jgi:hypothetical protein
MTELHLTLLCPPDIEEKILDLLLLTPEVRVFTSAPTAAHGLGLSELNTTEQVLGRARMVQVEALLSEEHKDALLLVIRREFARTGVRYWLAPVVESGDIA